MNSPATPLPWTAHKRYVNPPPEWARGVAECEMLPPAEAAQDAAYIAHAANSYPQLVEALRDVANHGPICGIECGPEMAADARSLLTELGEA